MIGSARRMARILAPGMVLLPIATAAQQAPPTLPPPAQDTAAPQQPAVAPVAELPNVNIVAQAPLVGTGIDVSKVPSATSVQTGQDIVRLGIPDYLGALDRNIPGVTLDQTSGNPFQPDLLYRGFTASPLAGSNEGIAVYVNGARFNSPFGDLVNWDLIPDEAIDRVDLEGSNPVYGLNALGGSLNVRMKNGFTYNGGEFTAYGGSFGRIGANFEYGVRSGNSAAYIAGDTIHDDGWRDKSSSDLHRIFGDIGWRNEDTEAHVSITGAITDLNGPGTTPVQLLDVDRSAEFTSPNVTHNKYLSLNANISHDLNDTTTLQAVAYYSNYSQRLVNGNTPDFQPCDASGGLCEGDGVTPLTDRNGAQIPDFLNGGPYSELDTNSIDTNAFGAALQASDDRDVLGHTNNFLIGVSYDGGVSEFDGNTLAGGLTADRSFTGPEVSVDQSDLSIAPVRVQSTNSYGGIYFSDVFDVTKRLSATVSGRYNMAQIDLDDQIGTTGSGNHSINRFNPGAGLTFKILPNVSVYGSYSEANRAPTPAEFSCADINSPCTLANFFTGDPNLKQIVAHTFEAGLRGVAQPFPGGRLTWDADLYRTDTDDDIIFSPSYIIGRDFFQNIGSTRREGAEASVGLAYGALSATLEYAYTQATFQSAFALDSSLNPGADANGQIHVVPGDRLPGIPAQQLKGNVSYRLTKQWTVGAHAIASSGQVLFGDEANLTPRTGSYFVLNLDTQYQLTPHVELFALLDNVTDTKYATYGTFSDVTSIPIAQVPNASNTRALDPGAPIAVYGGVRVTF
jgi:outer membrane receptor protein involved in Fe transport